ncbi:MAG: cytochrome c oxidase subunit II [Haloarculaceae archaeon]
MAASGGGLLGGVALSGAFRGGSLLAGAGGVRAPAELFGSIFIVFVVLGTLVGIVVISYTLYNAYKYRYREEKDPAPEADRPEMGELPEGGGKGKKLFLSFGMSAIIVLSLILWTYGALQYYESKPEQIEKGGKVLDLDVTGYQFGWRFTYPSGANTTTLRVPADQVVRLHVTSTDVFHNFGVPALRVKSDAIPGQTTTAWFSAEKTGTYQAQCYELCGVGHSQMEAQVRVMKPSAYQEWYSGLNATTNATQVSNP